MSRFPPLIILFGLPGAGKSFVADILRTHFGLATYNGDDDLPETMKRALLNKEVISDDMRHAFVEHMISSITKQLMEQSGIVVHQTFLKEFMRKKILDVFPHTFFFLVVADDSVREARYMKRSYFNLGQNYLRHMSSLFETPHIPHEIIDNSKDGEQNVKDQLERIFRRKKIILNNP